MKAIRSAVAKKPAKRTDASMLRVREAAPTAPTLVHMNAQGRVTLPASARRRFGLESEADLLLELEGDALVLRPSVVLLRSDAWAYTTEHRSLLRRAHRDSRAGRVRNLSERELDRQA